VRGVRTTGETKKRRNSFQVLKLSGPGGIYKKRGRRVSEVHLLGFCEKRDYERLTKYPNREKTVNELKNVTQGDLDCRLTSYLNSYPRARVIL